MDIVVLDGYTLNPGDLSWEGLEALGDCRIYDRTPAEETVARARDAEIVLTNKVALGSDEIAALPKMQYIGVLATGYNVVDVAAARKRDIPVTNVPTYGTQSVAQMVFAHILNLTQHVAHHARTVRDGRWGTSPDFCYWDFPLTELAGQTIGIIGFGRIGRATAAIAKAFGMRILAYDTSPVNDESGLIYADLDAIVRESDVISLHCPLSAENEGLIGAERLAMMKRTAFLINTSRGPLVDQEALAAALNDGRIAGAGLDVLSVEPARGDNPLLTARNCFITPHIAWATKSARERLMNTAVENVRAFIDGEPVNVVN